MIRRYFSNLLLNYPKLAGYIKRFFYSDLLTRNWFYQQYMLNRARKYSDNYMEEKRLSIETILTCNALCLMCGHGTANMSGMMDMDLYEKIIEDCRRNNIKNVGLSIYGEPLLDKYFFKRVELLKKYQITYSISTNASLLNADIANKILILGGLKKINFSVCGYSKEVYESIMKGLNRDVVYENILNFLKLKKELGIKSLTVGVSNVKLKNNSEEIGRYIKFWKAQEGIDYVIVADFWDRVGNVSMKNKKNIGEVRKYAKWLQPCRQLWDSLYVYYDGRVAPCCVDADKRNLIVGDLRRQSIDEIYKSKPLKVLRKIHIDNKRYYHSICGKCSYNMPWL